jgi:hypothetical protein
MYELGGKAGQIASCPRLRHEVSYKHHPCEGRYVLARGTSRTSSDVPNIKSLHEGESTGTGQRESAGQRRGYLVVIQRGRQTGSASPDGSWSGDGGGPVPISYYSFGGGKQFLVGDPVCMAARGPFLQPDRRGDGQSIWHQRCNLSPTTFPTIAFLVRKTTHP